MPSPLNIHPQQKSFSENIAQPPLPVPITGPAYPTYQNFQQQHHQSQQQQIQQLHQRQLAQQQTVFPQQPPPTPPQPPSLAPPPISTTKPASSSPIPRSGSPVAPEYSPITPKVQPVLPVKPAFIPPPDNGGNFTFAMDESTNTGTPPLPSLVQPPPVQEQKKPSPPPPEQVKKPIPEAVYIPQPPNQPFSADDATDAIALRAAISTLQFQKKKAQDDMRQLAKIKQMALDEPDRFKDELAAGRLKEQRHVIGNMQAILANLDEGDDDDEVLFELATTDKPNEGTQSPRSLRSEIPDSQPSHAAPSSQTQDTDMVDSFTSEKPSRPFPRIPGPQDVVRMPYVNWDKYGVVGDGLESIHAQQQKWPGTTGGNSQCRGREYSVAAPYSPFLDRIDAAPPQPRQEARKDSAAASPSSAGNGSDSTGR